LPNAVHDFPTDAENAVQAMLSPTGGFLPSSVRAFHLPELSGDSDAASEVVSTQFESCNETAAAAVADAAAENTLDIRIDLGRARLSPDDARLLRKGSVVSLDRHIEEPVEICAAGRLIGRGNVLVVDGKIAVRLVELLSKEAAS
jgi:flagellar motor switch protein FliN